MAPDMRYGRVYAARYLLLETMRIDGLSATEDILMGMTMKQWWRNRYLALCEEYADADVTADPARFVALSVALHVAKGHVPRRFWHLANKRGRNGGRHALVV